MDFTFKIYEELLQALIGADYNFITFEEYFTLKDVEEPLVILRHDVDRKPYNAVVMAEIEKKHNVKASYYFRVVPEAWDTEVIKKIAELGHECGYHYEDLDLAKGDIDKAYEMAKKHLTMIKEFYPVQTICMHGSPLSPNDNKEVWRKYNYRDLGIIAEPYFDLDYEKVLYITDTGRAWNKTNVSVRDKVATSLSVNVKTTQQLIELIHEDHCPNQLMINTHPNRWNSSIVPWTKELVNQNLKNVIKYALIKIRK
ncbi:MAG: hypothetical protein SCALA702_33670 [Melioribacteraceae bacterium]|nr:MAG: hypothetical protein SCALA702_33670 [Melioribacteraceae bacterium]